MNQSVPADRIIVADYVEREILDCLRHYKEYMILSWTSGYWLGDVELELWIFTKDGREDKFILLGNANYIYKARPNWSPNYKIQDADKLRVELLDIIEKQGTGLSD